MRYMQNKFLTRPNFVVHNSFDDACIGLRFLPTAKAGARQLRSFGFWRVRWKDAC